MLRRMQRETVDYMTLMFLRAEFLPYRFTKQLLQEVEQAGGESNLLQYPDLKNVQENRLRAKLLTHLRGWPNKGLFARFPLDISWYRAALPIADCKKLHYIDYGYWNDLTNNTHLVEDGANAVKRGKIISNQPNNIFWDITRVIDAEKPMTPIIIVGSSKAETYTILEGHKRATAYVLAQSAPPILDVVLGLSSHIQSWGNYPTI